jgi:hypothetical protein
VATTRRPKFVHNALRPTIRDSFGKLAQVIAEPFRRDGLNLYGAFGVKRISSRASLTSLELNRVRSRAVARLR